MTVKECLVKARKLIENEENWWSAGSGGYRPKTECALTALFFLANSSVQRECMHILDQTVGMPIETFNDTHTHAEVIAAYDKVIASL